MGRRTDATGTTLRFGRHHVHAFYRPPADDGPCPWSTLSAAQPEAASVAVVAGEQIQEIMPGMLKGYLSKEEQLDSKAFLPPAPEGSSALQAMDTAWSEKMF